MTVQSAVARQLAAKGRPWTLKSVSASAGANAWTLGATATTFWACQARERAYSADEVKGGIMDSDAELVIDAASLGTTPQSGDYVTPGRVSSDVGADWRRVVVVKPAHVGERVGVWRLQVRK